MPSDSAKIFSLLWSIGRRMRDGKHRYSMLHFQTLRYIKEKGRPFMQDVARHLCITPPAATLLVEGLVKEGLVSRSFDKKDRRVVRTALTKEGKAFLARGVRMRKKKLEGLFAVLTHRERAAFITILRKIDAAAGNR